MEPKTFSFEEFAKCHRPNTNKLIQELAGKALSESEFINHYKGLGGSKRTPNKARRIYKFLTKVGHFKKPN